MGSIFNHKARFDQINFRYVPFEHASKVMQDNVFSDIIEVGKTNAARNQVRFIKRRARLIGPNGIHLYLLSMPCSLYLKT